MTEWEKQDAFDKIKALVNGFNYTPESFELVATLDVIRKILENPSSIAISDADSD